MRRLFSLVALLGVAGHGCDAPGAPSRLRGGVLATFAVGAERFKVFVTNPAAIDALFRLRDTPAEALIPNGRIKRGSGDGAHNAPYSWHLDPQDFEMAGVTIELCDGRPLYVEANVDEYVDVVGRYCPWGAKLVQLTDLR